MSMGPARLSRRSLLRGAASVAVVTVVAAVSSCTGDPAQVADAPDDATPLLRLGRSIPDGPSSRNGAPDTAAVGGPTDDGAVVRAVDEQGDAIAADFTAGATVVATGWLLSTTEADVLADYARTCPVGSC